jgi:hypothetical protein
MSRALGMILSHDMQRATVAGADLILDVDDLQARPADVLDCIGATPNSSWADLLP